jgi:hypothetical protein
MARQSRYRRIRRLFAPSRHFVGQGLGHELNLLIGITAGTSAALAQLDRYEPVHIRVLQQCHKSTGAAFAARFLAWCIALEQLGEPQRETLFTDPAWSGQQECLRQPSGGVGARQSSLNPFVPNQGR